MIFIMLTKKEIVDKLIFELDHKIPFSFIKKQKKANRVRYFFENNNSIEFLFDSVMSGKKGKGSFVLSFSLSIFNPFFSKIRYESFKLDYNPEEDNCNLTLHLSYLNNLPKEWNVYDRYMFSDEKNNNEIIKIILDDIQSCFFIYIASFIQKDYYLLLENYKNISFVKNIGNWNQFVYGVIAAFLTDQKEFIEETLVPMAKSNTNKIEFLEFKKSQNYQEELVMPIKKYILMENIIR